MNKLQNVKLQIELNLDIFKQNVLNSNSISDLLKIYNIWDCGTSRKIFKEALFKFNISILHWKWYKKFQKYEQIEKICPVCQTPFQTKKNHPKETYTCSYKCSSIYFKDKRHSKEICKKISEGVKNYYSSKIKIKHIINCLMCGKEKLTKKFTQKFCSNKCSAEYRKTDPTYLQHLREGVRKSVLEGRHKPWTSRKIISYPEKFFMGILDNNHILYKHNLKCGKYFIDFAIEDKKIALEIDGKQHLYEDRQQKDKEKDKYLVDSGWIVYRIPWKSINTNEGKLYIKQEIDKFLQILL